jgi:hypothetical protein
MTILKIRICCDDGAGCHDGQPYTSNRYQRSEKMKMHKIAAVLLSVCGIYAGSLSAGDEYSFKVHNTTKAAITKLLVSEDGKEWGFFDIGAGIPAGATETLVWSEETKDEDCKQYFKAEFSDGDESEPVIFNFCEEKLELEF